MLHKCQIAFQVWWSRYATWLCNGSRAKSRPVFILRHAFWFCVNKEISIIINSKSVCVTISQQSINCCVHFLRISWKYAAHTLGWMDFHYYSGSAHSATSGKKLMFRCHQKIQWIKKKGPQKVALKAGPTLHCRLPDCESVFPWALVRCHWPLS